MTKPVMFFDCETTGLPLKGVPIDDESQPHIIRYSAILECDGWSDRTEIRRKFIKPAGWQSAEGATETHGLSMREAGRRGIREKIAMLDISHMLKTVSEFVTYGSFDIEILVSLAMRHGGSRQDIMRPGLRWHNLMHICTPICAIPSTNEYFIGDHKFPSLAQAAKIILDHDHEDDAHDDWADTLVVKSLYDALMERGEIEHAA